MGINKPHLNLVTTLSKKPNAVDKEAINIKIIMIRFINIEAGIIENNIFYALKELGIAGASVFHKRLHVVPDRLQSFSVVTEKRGKFITDLFGNVIRI